MSLWHYFGYFAKSIGLGQVDENYSYLFYLRLNISKFRCLDAHFVHNKCDLNGW